MRGPVNARILVVDDDTALAEMIGIVLRTEGFEPHFCEDGGTAVDAFRSAKPDLVLLDIEMPEMDGISAIRAILQASPGAKIVVCTAMSKHNQIQEAVAAGAKDFIVKPFRDEKVWKTLSAA